MTDEHRNILTNIIMNDFDIRPSFAKIIVDALISKAEEMIKEDECHVICSTKPSRFKTGERVLVIAPPNVLWGAYRNGHKAIVVSPPPSDESDSYCIRFDDGTEDYYFETWLKSAENES